MSALARAEAPCTSSWRTRKPSAAKRLSTPAPMLAARRWPRWPVASVAASARARTATAPVSASWGERPRGSRAAREGRRAGLGGCLAGGFACTREPPRTAPAIRVLRDPKHQSVEIHPLQRRLLWDERSGRHAGLGVHLKEDQNVVNVVITQVRAGNPAATQRGVRQLAHSQSLFKGMRRNVGGHDMRRSAVGVLGLVFVKT